MKYLAMENSWADLDVGHSVSFPLSISTEDLKTYAVLSGDFNPLHTDDGFAEEQGYEGVVVYAGLLLAFVSHAIGMHLPGRYGIWSGISMQFNNPLYVGEEARLEAILKAKTVSVRLLKIAIKISRGQTLIAKGSADVIHRDGF